MLAEVKDFWPVFVGVAAVIIWLIRLEGRLNAAAIAVLALAAQRREDVEQAARVRAEDRLHSDSQRSELHRMLEGVQNDIKIILREVKR